MMITPVLLSLLGAWFGHANPVSHIPGVVFLFPAVLFWLGLREPTPRAAFRSGWICGSIAFAACLYWIFIPVHVYGGLHWILALPCPLLLGMYLGLYSGLFSALIRWMHPVLPPVALALGGGVLWGALEMAQGTLFTGFSWLTLPAAMAPWPVTIQSLALVGEYWLSAIFVTCTAWLMLSFRSRYCLILGLSSVLLLILYGVTAVKSPLPDGERIRVALIQGNIDQSLKWDPEFQEATIQKYLQLTRKEMSSQPDLVVWPETAIPFYLQEENALSRQVRDFVRTNRFTLLTGAPRYQIDLLTGEIRYANSAFLLNPAGETVGVYDKEHLVPFGEYVPLSRLFPFISRLAHGDGEFIPGDDPRPLRLEKLALGMLICYEAIFPGLSQERIRAGANLLVNISNDAWFGHSSAPRQHLHQAVLRAVEQGRYLVRSTNTGITAIVDPRGRRLEAGTLFQQLTLSYPDIRLIDETTLFHRHYSFFQWTLPGAALLIVIITSWAGLRRHS
ncbi:apolipoprotein N-acyltransferase [Desulfonatronum parangueonense]